jgi:hypothetical protein
MGLSACWIWVCAYATLQFFKSQLVWVTQGAPNSMLDLQQRIKTLKTYCQHVWLLWDIEHKPTLDLSCSTRWQAKVSCQLIHPSNYAEKAQISSIYHADPSPKSGSHQLHRLRRYSGRFHVGANTLWSHLCEKYNMYVSRLVSIIDPFFCTNSEDNACRDVICWYLKLVEPDCVVGWTANLDTFSSVEWLALQ